MRGNWIEDYHEKNEMLKQVQHDGRGGSFRFLSQQVLARVPVKKDFPRKRGMDIAPCVRNDKNWVMHHRESVKRDFSLWSK